MKELDLATFISTRLNAGYRGYRATPEIIQEIIDDVSNVFGICEFGLYCNDLDELVRIAIDMRTNYYLAHYQSDTMINSHVNRWVESVKGRLSQEINISELDDFIKESWTNLINELFYYGYITTLYHEDSIRLDHYLMDISNDYVSFNGGGLEDVEFN